MNFVATFFVHVHTGMTYPELNLWLNFTLQYSHALLIILKVSLQIVHLYIEKQFLDILISIVILWWLCNNYKFSIHSPVYIHLLTASQNANTWNFQECYRCWIKWAQHTFACPIIESWNYNTKTKTHHNEAAALSYMSCFRKADC